MATLYNTSPMEDPGVLEVHPNGGREEFGISEITGMLGREIESTYIPGHVVFVGNQSYKRFGKNVTLPPELQSDILRSLKGIEHMDEDVWGPVLVCSFEEAGEEEPKPTICFPWERIQKQAEK